MMESFRRYLEDFYNCPCECRDGEYYLRPDVPIEYIKLTSVIIDGEYFLKPIKAPKLIIVKKKDKKRTISNTLRS